MLGCYITCYICTYITCYTTCYIICLSNVLYDRFLTGICQEYDIFMSYSRSGRFVDRATVISARNQGSRPHNARFCEKSAPPAFLLCQAPQQGSLFFSAPRPRRPSAPANPDSCYISRYKRVLYNMSYHIPRALI
jgi:hypothetical protein